MTAIINQVAPQPLIETWVQGHEPPITELVGNVILIEVIQVNCPGCLLHALPKVIDLHDTYSDQGLKVFGIATAFEHYEHNTVNNLERLLQHGEVQGDPLVQLSKAGFLDGNKLPYKIPFSVAMDQLIKTEVTVNEQSINQLIISQIPDFHQQQWSDDRKQAIYQQAEAYLSNKQFSPQTFEMFQLQGTPSSILIDKHGILREVSFGEVNKIENKIQALLSDK